MKTTYRKVLSRRTVLRGAGGIIVGLPFLDEMRVNSVYAQEPAVVRAFNVFFGLGYQMAIQELGLAKGGKLKPGEPLIDKFGDRLQFLRGISQTKCNGSGNAHYDGSSAAFTGTPADRIDKSRNVPGGASMDQALRLHAYPNGLPSGVLNGLNTGTWWRYSDSTQRYIHSRLPDGSPAGDAVPPQDPKELFDKLFEGKGVSGSATLGGGSGQPQQPDGTAERARKMRRSILDGLKEEYDYYSGPRGGLGEVSRGRVRNYFEQVRAMEEEVAAGPGVPVAPPAVVEPTPQTTIDCGAIENPGGDWISHRNGGDGDGIDITVDGVQREVRMMAKLFALGVACDRVRFGSFVFQSGGERIRMHGKYSYNGTEIVDWDEGSTSHGLWHGNKYDGSAKHLHFSMNQFAYFFEQLDAIVENGKSVFDTAMITMSTESGNGKHNSDELKNVFHCINGANGKNKVGAREFVDISTDGIDVYNTMLMAQGVPAGSRLWDGQGDESATLLV